MEDKRNVGFEMRTLNILFKRCIDSSRPREIEGLTGIQCLALRFFYENRHRDVFQRDFEEQFSVRRSTATNILQLMERNGMIKRVSIDRDARLKKIVLTQKAVDIHKGIVRSVSDCENKVTKGISSQELACFFATLDKMKANLEVQND